MTKTRVHRKMEHVFEQLKYTLGEDVRLIMKNDMKKLSIDANQVVVFSSYYCNFSLSMYLMIDRFLPIDIYFMESRLSNLN